MLAGMALDRGIIASTVVEGSFNHDLFVNFLREDLVRLLCFCFTMNGSPDTSV